jgi:hypothetical protein
MMSWSYQSTNPCTVLVKEKPDSHQVDCSPSLQSSTNRPSLDAQQDHQQDSVVSSSSGISNIIGGKVVRSKRQVLDVVVDGVGHEQEEEEEALVESIEKRILVNISIGMDKGLGTRRQEVYVLQVAVPLKNEPRAEREFYSYEVHEGPQENEGNPEEDEFLLFQNSTELFASEDSTTSLPHDCCEGLRKCN